MTQCSAQYWARAALRELSALGVGRCAPPAPQRRRPIQLVGL